MLQRLLRLAQATSKQDVTSVESEMDEFYCNNPIDATSEALSIISNAELNPHARHLAASFLYDFVERRWRVPRESATQNTREMQTKIKEMLIHTTINNPIDHKATLHKFASLIGRISRFEFPILWSGGCFEPIINHLTANNGQNNTHSYLRYQMLSVMLYSLREISSNTGARTKQKISEAASHCLRFAVGITGQCLDQLFTSEAPNDWKSNNNNNSKQLVVKEMEVVAQILLLCAACINMDVETIMRSLSVAERFSKMAGDLNDNNPNKEDVVMLAEHFSKIVVWAVEKFGTQLPDEDTFVTIGNFFINGMQQGFSDQMRAGSANALKTLLDLAEGGSQTSSRIRAALQNRVLTPNAVETLIRDLVSRSLRDDESDLKEWDADPEYYVIEHDDAKEEEVNPSLAAEQFFLSLVSSDWPGIVKLVWNILTDALSSPDPSFIAAALHAIGLGYMCLGSPDDFVSFLRDKLVPAMQSSNTPPLVLRRVVWVVGMWVDSLIDQDVRRRVFEVLADLLERNPHPVVTLTCLGSVYHLLTDSINFTPANVVGRPLQCILRTVTNLFPNLRGRESITRFAGIILIISTLVVPHEPEAANDVRNFQPYKAVLNALEGYIQRTATNRDRDFEECSAAMELLKALNSAFEYNLLASDDIMRSLALSLECTDPEQPIHTWLQDEAWEVVATFMARDPPAEVYPKVFAAATAAAQRDFDGVDDAIKTLAFLALFAGEGNNNLFSPALGEEAIKIITESDSSSAIIKHNAVLLLEAVIRRFPNYEWSSKIQNLFSSFGNAEVTSMSALDAVAICLCFERQRVPLPPGLCSDFIAKCVECGDVLPNSYSKLVLLQGLANMMSILNGTEFFKDASDALDGLKESIMCGGPDMMVNEEVTSHWGSEKVKFLAEERMKRM